MFRPKLIDAVRQYSRSQLKNDLTAGVIVGIVALPLAIAFAIASGVTPEKGLITAIVAGFLISALGGSRVQIGGPTGAFIVVVYGIVGQHGASGLIIATFIAGVMLILTGLCRLGNVIKFIPHPLIVGFTSGVAVIIFSSQVRDIFGLDMTTVPADFFEKWRSYYRHSVPVNGYSVLLAVLTIVLSVLLPRLTRSIPGSLVAIVMCTLAVLIFKLPVETIGSRFGAIPADLSAPEMPVFTWPLIRQLIQPAFTIAMLCGIESLLSAVVADGMIGGRHRSNTELIAQGVANMGSAIFGGIPATGAIARTATNVKNGGRTPVAGIAHVITLLLITLLAGRWATLIPLSCLAGILVVVAFNMSEYKTFFRIAKGGRADALVLFATFFLTVFVDLTVAIEVGLILALLLFLRQMIQVSEVKSLVAPEGSDALTHKPADRYQIPTGVEIFEITGPLFFGAAYKFKDAIRLIAGKPAVLIVNMKYVPVIDATGLQTLADVLQLCRRDGTCLILSGTEARVLVKLKSSRLLFKIGKRYVLPTMEAAIERAKQFIAVQKAAAYNV